MLFYTKKKKKLRQIVKSRTKDVCYNVNNMENEWKKDIISDSALHLSKNTVCLQFGSANQIILLLIKCKNII